MHNYVDVFSKCIAGEDFSGGGQQAPAGLTIYKLYKNTNTQMFDVQIYNAQIIVIFSCPGNSIPDLGQ